MFVNAGMNQFKDIFLDYSKPKHHRVVILNAASVFQVSIMTRKVGHDTYHHTFFEMLGNWSFGDYFKKMQFIGHGNF